MKQHKHSELIKAWADGAEIQERYARGRTSDDFDWEEFKGDWSKIDEYDYRIKPEPKPDGWTLYFAERGRNPIRKLNRVGANLWLIWDGETGELKSAEVLK